MEDEGEPRSFFKVIKTILILAILGISAITVLLTYTGVTDLKDDDKVMIIVMEDEQPRAAAIYARKSKEVFEVNADDLPSEVRLYELFDAAEKKYGTIDRIVVGGKDMLTLLGNSETIAYNGNEVTVAQFLSYLNGEDIPADLKGTKEDWQVESLLLQRWTKDYANALWRGDLSLKELRLQYLEGKIRVYPKNFMLSALPRFPLENLF